jgi:1-deoxy-D-xylulose-5-phosphate reductoisomerase
MKRIVILGSTGSIGEQTLAVVRRFPDRLTVLGLAARRQDILLQQAREFAPEVVVIGDDRPRIVDFPPETEVRHGPEALAELASHPAADLVVVSTVGRAGLLATLAALRAGKRVCLANKEVLVMAGALVTATARTYGGTLIPVDSEHSALWQCLVGEPAGSVQTLLLTASGGALRHVPAEELQSVTPSMALSHPTWKMGAKVTVDSASLMNKGLEVIEAHWLFSVPYEQIRVVLHPTSVVHSLVQFVDGSFKAHLGLTDMRLAIQYALSHPERWAHQELQVDLLKLGDLRFSEPDWSRYPCLSLALQAGRQAGTYPAVLCGADEVAVDLFLAGSIRFTDIPVLVEQVLSRHSGASDPDLEQLLAADAWARSLSLDIARGLPA